MPTHGRRSQLPAVLAPLLDDPLIDQLIVVVDGSDDGSIEWLRKAATEHPALLPHLRDHSGGAQVARADGLERATGDVVLFLDDDVLAGQGLAHGHITHHAQRDNVVVVGYMPVSLPTHRRPGQFASYLYADEYEQRCRDYDEHPDAILRNLWWGNVSMRRLDAESVGLTSHGFEHLYHEDQDFGIRCLEQGLDAVFDRSLSAVHLHDRDIDAFIRDARSQGAGRAVLHQRHAALLGDLQPGDFADGLPFPAAVLVRGSGRPEVAAASSTAMRAVSLAAGRLGWYGIETRAGKVLRRVNQRSGAETVWSNGRTPTRSTDARGST